MYAALYPVEPAGFVFVDGAHPDLLAKLRPGGSRMERMPGFVGHGQDAMARFMNQVGFYRLGLPARTAPAPPPIGFTSAEWETVWRLTQSAKARAALMEEIASWAQSMAEVRKAGGLGDRPLIVLGGEETLPTPEFRNVWSELQADLARLSTRARNVAVDETNGELIHRAPDAVVRAALEVIGAVRGKRL
jgi:hypothetical protein